MSSPENLNQIRKKLTEALGDKKDLYFFHMKQWFRMKATKEDFDSNARDLLATSQVHLHNEFLLAILTKCQLCVAPHNYASVQVKTEVVEEQILDKRSADSSQNLHSAIVNGRKRTKSNKPKCKVFSPFVETHFEAVDIQDVIPTANLRDPSAIADAGPGYYKQSLHMLDPGPLKGRLLLAAWDHGLGGINDNVSILLQEAAKQCLKNILTAVISRRKGYRLRERKFIHSLGTIPANPWLRNSSLLCDWISESPGFPFGEGEGSQWPTWPTVDAAEQNAAHLASCAPSVDVLLPPVSAYDLFTTLQIHRSVLPCHSVYALNMERISARLWHPSSIELEQESIATKEAAVREYLREQRLAANHVS